MFLIKCVSNVTLTFLLQSGNLVSCDCFTSGSTCLRIFSVAKATLESQMSVRPSVRLLQKPLSLSELFLSAIEPIDNRAYRPLSLLTIKPIDLWSSFATFKPFRLFCIHFICNLTVICSMKI